MTSILCLSEEFKGAPFLQVMKEHGCKVFVVTREKARDKPWPMQYIDELFVQPDSRHKPHDRQSMIEGTAWLFKKHGIDCIIALDDFDVEDAALIREEFRISGMGQTTARHFRDKLAMRMQAAKHAIPAPAFSSLFRREQLEHFCKTHNGPYLIKPRSEASAAGIQKVADGEQALAAFDTLGDQSYKFLIETFAPGQVYHVDAMVVDGKLSFVRSSAYVDPPLSIVQGGGTFQTRTIDLKSAEHEELKQLTGQVMAAFNLKFSASHTEWIRTVDGRFLFLETSSRVGGAHISDMLVEATGADLWAEWAKLELAMLHGKKYKAPKDKGEYAAVTIRTVGEEFPDCKEFCNQHVTALAPMKYHAAFCLSGKTHQEVKEQQEQLYHRLRERFG